MKRYDFIGDNIASCYCDMEERENGSYVEYDDMVNLLKKLTNDGGLDKDCMNLIIDALAEN